MVDMNLVSLIDVFTILIFFLLSSAGVETMPSLKSVQLPQSTAEKSPKGDAGGHRERAGDRGRRPPGGQSVPEADGAAGRPDPGLQAELKLLAQRT